MKHKYYYEISAKTNLELGQIRGELFGDVARQTWDVSRKGENWQKKVELAHDYLMITKKYFPLLVEELEGYAEASKLPFKEFWTMSLEDDLDQVDLEKCTTIVTNNGRLISHNEDWDVGAEDLICVLKKTLNNVTTLELFYYNTLGSVSTCINSFGYTMMINTLTHTDRQIGVPRNVIGRWLAETKSPEEDFEKLKTIPRSLGYNHLFTHKNGGIWDIECTATKEVLLKPPLPYVHTNHYLSPELRKFEENDDSTGTYERYDAACGLVKPQMNIEEIMNLGNSKATGGKDSIMNERTIGKMIIDLQQAAAYVWLRRESDLGFVRYDLDFI